MNMSVDLAATAPRVRKYQDTIHEIKIIVHPSHAAPADRDEELSSISSAVRRR